MVVKKISLEEEKKLWLSWLKHEKGYAQNTILSYKADVERFIDFFVFQHKGSSMCGSKDVDSGFMRMWLGSFHNHSHGIKKNISSKKPISANSVHRIYSGLKNFASYCYKKHKVNFLESVVLDLPKVSKPLPKSISVDDIKDTLENLREANRNNWVNARNTALLSLLYSSGLRISEALSLNRGVLNKLDIHVVGKGGKSRAVPWNEKVKILVKDYVNLIPRAGVFEENNEDSPLFIGIGGKRLTRQVFNRELSKLSLCSNDMESGYGLQLSAHSLRHSFASHLLAENIDLRSIQKLLGHSSLSSTQIYTKVDLNRLENAYMNAQTKAKK